MCTLKMIAFVDYLIKAANVVKSIPFVFILNKEMCTFIYICVHFYCAALVRC